MVPKKNTPEGGLFHMAIENHREVFFICFFHTIPQAQTKSDWVFCCPKQFWTWSRVAGSMGQSESVMPSELDGNEGPQQL